ncbi:MAG: hypothetical protein OXT74_00235, partial [Candidatus Poribacteria bacterium]|nr:hypothetical protein [Candidatus Poribacteria bacterium]
MGSVLLRPISVLIAVALFCAYTNSYATTRIGDITINPRISPGGNSNHGYADFELSVLNHSSDKMHVVTLILPNDSHGNAPDRIREITRSVVVGPGATAHVSLLQPPVPLYGNDLAVAIDGRRQKEEISVSVGSHAHGTSHTFISHSALGTTGFKTYPLSLQILVSRNVDTSELHTHAGSLVNTIPTTSGFWLSRPASGSFPTHRISPGSSGSASYDLIDLGFPVSAWSTNWLGFSRYDGVVVTDEDVQQMPSDVQSALWRYVECGGALLVLGGNHLPDDWTSRIEIPDMSAGI